MADDAAAYEMHIDNQYSDNEEQSSEYGEELEMSRGYYPSNIPEQYIVNASSGNLYNFKVGSKESLQLFHVVDTTGFYGSNGLPTNIVNRESNNLYYNDPYEYMRHRGIKLSKEVIDKWRTKVNLLFPTPNQKSPDEEALELIRREKKKDIMRQYDEAIARDVKMKIEQEERKKAEKLKEEFLESLLEVYAINKANAKAERKKERLEAKKARNKRKKKLYKERKRAKLEFLAKRLKKKENKMVLQRTDSN